MDKRTAQRLGCSIDVLACTTLAVRDARIVNISGAGAKLRLEEPFPVGTAIHLDLDGDFYWGRVVWTAADGMGVRFRAPIAAGALRERVGSLRARSVPVVGRVAGFGRRPANGR